MIDWLRYLGVRITKSLLRRTLGSPNFFEQHAMNPLASYIEHTHLSPTLTAQDVERMVGEAKQYGMAGLCLPPFWIKKARRELGPADTRLVTVAGFPLGYQMTQTKTAEMEQALRDGADEVDLVMNVSAFKSRMPWVKIEVAKCATLVHEREALLKVIIETAYLDEEEITEAATWCADAGADFVKTSTGFAPSGATEEHVRLLRRVLPSTVGIKAAGGIRTAAQARAMIEAGADRIGTSSAVAMLTELSAE